MRSFREREGDEDNTPYPARGQTVIFIIIADLHKRLSMEMLLEECFCSVIMETIFQQGSWLRPAPPPHNQEFLAAAQGL